MKLTCIMIKKDAACKNLKEVKVVLTWSICHMLTSDVLWLDRHVNLNGLEY